MVAGQWAAIKLPVAMDCTTLAELPRPSHMHVAELRLNCGEHGAFDRRSNGSSALLPYARPYSDTKLELRLNVGKLEVPYDPPFTDATPAEALLKLDVQVRGASPGRDNVMQLEGAIERISIEPN